MSRFTQTLNPDASQPELAEIYGEVMQNGFGKKTPLNWFTSISKRPDILAACWGFAKSIILQGQVPATVKQMIAVKISTANQCEYCSVIYSRALRAMGVKPEVIDCVTNDLSLSRVPPSQRAILQFALKASKHQQNLTDEDFQALYDFGLSQGEVMEILLVAGYTNFINFWAEASGIRVDEAAA